MNGQAEAWRRSVLLASISGALVIQLIDRLRFARIPSAPLGRWIDQGEQAFLDPLLVAVGTDVLVLVGLVLLGGLLVPRAVPLGMARPVIALIAGASLQVVVSLLLLPAAASLAVLVIAAGALHWWLQRSGLGGGWAQRDVPPLVLTLVVTILVAVRVRSRVLVVLSSDSSEYW